ncbi:hypothetical protein EAS62_36565 [Bradyrhizobium zhanjiangense]|uniref:Uncharacterized protein n=1 Tax=Bradyrhizobium zhanjiangense TaxID=1325107 RepID=A0ABY0DAJ8_9BRAD|nr:hypothetical protein EAS62_36565 [Bradyrhizobium zhanjiangense]
MRQEANISGDGTAPPLPLAGETQAAFGRRPLRRRRCEASAIGERASASGHSQRGESPHPALRADLSRKRERLQRACGETGSISRHILFTTPATSAA